MGCFISSRFAKTSLKMIEELSLVVDLYTQVGNSYAIIAMISLSKVFVFAVFYYSLTFDNNA